MTVSADPQEPDSALQLLARPGFSLVLAYRIFAMLSYQIVAVTVGWHIYEVTRNPFSLGLVGLAEVLPFFCVAPFAGYLVDHLPRRRLGMVACSGLVMTALVLTAVAQGWLPFHGVWPIYAAIALTGMVRAFLSPIYNALFARVRLAALRKVDELGALDGEWGWPEARWSEVLDAYYEEHDEILID
ncbi:MAG: MFS transporter, partial [Stenotrophomonas maltophilia]